VPAVEIFWENGIRRNTIRNLKINLMQLYWGVETNTYTNAIGGALAPSPH